MRLNFLSVKQIHVLIFKYICFVLFYKRLFLKFRSLARAKKNNFLKKGFVGSFLRTSMEKVAVKKLIRKRNFLVRQKRQGGLWWKDPFPRAFHLRCRTSWRGGLKFRKLIRRRRGSIIGHGRQSLKKFLRRRLRRLTPYGIPAISSIYKGFSFLNKIPLAAHSKLNRYSLFLRRCLFFFRFLYRNNKQHILLKQSVSNAIIKQVRKFFYKSKTFLKRRILLSGLVAMKNNGQFSPGKYIEVFVFGFLFL